jgi:hypothetical protein
MDDQGYRNVSVDIKAIRLYLKSVKNASPSIEDARAYYSNWLNQTWLDPPNKRGAALKGFRIELELSRSKTHGAFRTDRHRPRGGRYKMFSASGLCCYRYGTH